MKRLLVAVIGLMIAAPGWAQTATGVGVGTARSSSSSHAAATAIGGGNATGGAGGVSSATGGNANATGGTSSVTIAGTPAQTTQDIHQSGSLSNVPNVYAPGLTAAGLETCLGSVSGGGSWLGTGISFGGTIPDPNCTARLDARTLWSFGLKKAAVARLCESDLIRASMPDVCQIYLPLPGYQPVAVAAAEQETPEQAYTGGPVEVIDRRTGALRTCADFNPTRHRCNAWAR